MNTNRLVFTTDWSGAASRIKDVADYGYLAWSPIVYLLWDNSWLDSFRKFREQHPEVIVIPRIRLDAIGDFGVESESHPGFYWQHRRWMERALGSGLAKDTGTATYDWTRSDLPACLGQYLCDVCGPLRDQRLIDGVTLINLPELPALPRPTLLQRLVRHIPRDYLDLVGIQVRTRLGVDSAVVLRGDSRPWSTAWATTFQEGAWDSREALAAFTAQAAIAGRSVLDDTLHDLNTLWPRALSFCKPRSSPPLDLGSHTLRYMGGAIAVQSNLNGKASIYWPDGEEVR